MFDQGSRTAFRGTAKAFAFDVLAAELSLDVINNKGWFFDKYLPLERQAVLMPLLHSEDIAAHRVAQALAPRMCEGVEDAETLKMFSGVPHFFEDHRKVVEQFNRFPSRNQALVSAS